MKKLAWTVSVALFCLSARSFGQVTSANLVGTVIDATDAAVPNATVTATNTATGVKLTTATTLDGVYRISNLPVGMYDVNVTASGFSPVTQSGIDLQLNLTSTVNFKLDVGAVTTSLNVEAVTAIDTTTAQVQNTFHTQPIADLPVAAVGLGVLNLSLLGSGVSSNGGMGAGTGPAVGGQRPRNNNFTIEGIDNNNKTITGPLVNIPNDAVAEFSVLQNQFAAEYGHSSGGQFNVIVRSGTNDLHGSLYNYMQNRNLNAIDQSLQNQGFKKNPRYDQNRLGGLVSGRILKNKWFYLTSFEYNPVGQASSRSAQVKTPTAAGYATLASLPGLSQTNFAILKQYVPAAPSPNGDVLLQGDGKTPVRVDGQTIALGILPIASPSYTNNYALVASSDYYFSSRDQLRGRIIYNKSAGIDTAAELPQFYLSAPTTNYLATLTEYHNFSPSLTNEFRLGYNRYNNTIPAGDFKFPGLDQFPNIVLNDTNLNIGPDPNSPWLTIQNLYQATDNATWTRGHHTVKIGFDGHKYIAPQAFTQRRRGEYNYNSTILYLLDFTPDNLSERSIGNVIYYGDQVAVYAYLNDSWRIQPNFTINLGLRYEYTTIPYGERLQRLNHISDTPGVLTFNEPVPQKRNFAPRIGLAYSPGTSGKTSIRAGFGTAYDVLYDNIGTLSQPPQLSTTVDTDPLGVPTGSGPNFLKNGGIPANSPVGQLNRADAIRLTSKYIPDQELPYSIQWNLGVQHVFARNYTFEARYLGTRGVHLNFQVRINKQPKITQTDFLPTYLEAPSQAALDALPITLARIQAKSDVVSQFREAGFTNFIQVFAPLGNSTYHGLALQLNRRLSNGLQMVTAYTWSRLIDDSTADFFTTYLTPRRPEDFTSLRRERATSALDRRHRLTISMIYDLPSFRKSSNWAARHILGNWEFAPIYTFESPEYATVQSAVDANLNGDSIGDRSIINPNGVDGTSSNVTALTNSAGATVAYLATNPNARYIKAQIGALANGGRNTLRTRRIDNVDFTLVKRISFKERMKFEMFGNFLNSFNHPQFTPGLLNKVNSIFTTGSGVLNFVTAGNKAFNNPEVAFNSNARVIQVGAKLVF
jgi:Carboxypeptidase regulatory-like domain